MATQDEMEAAAQRPADDLAAIQEEHPQAVALIIEWWRRHYLAAGHKRLGRVLLGRDSRGAPRDAATAAEPTRDD
jgi:hypothetical protein